MVREKERVNLTCEARGYPEPQILWRREDGKPIMASGMANDKGELMSAILEGLKRLTLSCKTFERISTHAQKISN